MTSTCKCGHKFSKHLTSGQAKNIRCMSKNCKCWYELKLIKENTMENLCQCGHDQDCHCFGVKCCCGGCTACVDCDKFIAVKREK